MTIAARLMIATMLCLAMLGLPGTAGVMAAPDTTRTDAGSVTPEIPLQQLGLANKLVLLGSDLPFDIAIPVPTGVNPQRLTGQIGSVINAVAGRVDVYDGRDTYLGTIAASGGAASAHFSLDISTAQVIDGIATLSFVLRNNNPPADSCTQLSSVTLSQLAVTYSGPTPFPDTVADFFPGYLDQIIIRVGANPSAERQQAALSLVANLTRLYRPMPVRIDIDSTDSGPGVDAAGSSRLVSFSDGPAGITVRDPGTRDAQLVISGKGAELLRQIQLFADRRFKLAQTPDAAVTAAIDNAAKVGTTRTFAQLGMSGEVSVLGMATLYVGFDAGEFGVGSIEGANLHLLARYTPVISGEGSVVVRSGATIVASHILDQSGVLDLTGDIPPESIRSNVGLGIEVHYTPRQQCAPMNDRITFALDPQSSVTVDPGFHNTGGFAVLPMAFTPQFNVAVDRPEHLRFAASVISLLAQQSSAPLHPHLTSLDDGVKSRIGLLIVAPGDDLSKRDLHPPMLIHGDNAVVVNGTPNTSVDLNRPVGVVQAFTDRGRTVLAVNGVQDWALVDRSFDYIRALDGNWHSLTGDVVATGAQNATVNLVVREGGPLIDVRPPQGWAWWAYASAGIAAAALLGALGIALVRYRRRGRGAV